MLLLGRKRTAHPNLLKLFTSSYSWTYEQDTREFSFLRRFFRHISTIFISIFFKIWNTNNQWKEADCQNMKFWDLINQRPPRKRRTK